MNKTPDTQYIKDNLFYYLNTIDKSTLNGEVLKNYNEITNDLNAKSIKKRHSYVSLKKKIATLLLSTSLILSLTPTNIVESSDSKLLDEITYTTLSGKNIDIKIYNDHAHISNSFKCDFEDRKNIVEYLKNYADSSDEIPYIRSSKALESEWYVHNACYLAGIYKESAEHADLDFVSDYRGTVNALTDLASLFYAQHGKFDFSTENEMDR